MKTNITTFVVIVGALALSWSAAGQSGTVMGIRPHGTAPQAVPAAFTVSMQVKGTNENDLTMNFVSVPLDQVLTYLSDAAGFIIVQETPVSGNVTIKGTHLTKDKVIDLLNGELNRNNYAAILDGRTVTISTKRDAETSRIPVLTGNDPAKIPNNGKIATWIVPIRFIEARQLVSDLSLFVSPQARVMANEAGNSIVITDQQANIRHLVEIIRAVDNSAEAETEIRVFPLKYASPVDVVNDLNSVFPSANSSDDQAPIQFADGPFGDAGTVASSSQQRLQKATQVTAVADARIQAVIVTAPKKLMNGIVSMMADLDVKSDRDQEVFVFQLQNGDPQQVTQVLQSMFSDGNTASSGTSSSQSSLLQTRAQNTTTQMSSGTTASTGIGSTGNGGGTGSQGSGGSVASGTSGGGGG